MQVVVEVEQTKVIMEQVEQQDLEEEEQVEELTK
jgi:hypothetical protein